MRWFDLGSNSEASDYDPLPKVDAAAGDEGIDDPDASDLAYLIPSPAATPDPQVNE